MMPKWAVTLAIGAVTLALAWLAAEIAWSLLWTRIL
jgi:hypothetical protein